MGTEEAVRPWPPLQSCSVCARGLQPGPGDLPALRSPAPWLPGDGITRSQIAAPSPKESRGNPGRSAQPPLGFQQGCRAGRGSPSWGWCWGSLGRVERALPPPLVQMGTPGSSGSPQSALPRDPSVSDVLLNRAGLSTKGRRTLQPWSAGMLLEAAW